MTSWLDRFLYNLRAGPVLDPKNYCNYYPCMSEGSSGTFTGFGDAVIGKDTNKTIQLVALAAVAIVLLKGFGK